MSRNYPIAFASGLLLQACLHAQTVPTATQPPTVPLQPEKTGQSFSSPTPIYQMNDVSKTLNLNQNQIANLDKLTDQTQAKYSDSYNKLNARNGNDRFTQGLELNRKFYGDWNTSARGIMNDNQWSRYQQLHYQYGGFNSLYEPVVQKELNLTPAQIKSLNEQSLWSAEQLQNINRIGATDPTKGTQMYRDYRKTYQERFNTFLTPEQLKSWQHLTGEPYNFQPTFVQPR